MKNYKDKEWLKNQIEVLGKSRRQVVRERNVSPSTIGYWYSEEKKKKKIIN